MRLAIVLGILLCTNLILAQDEGSGAEEAAGGEESSGKLYLLTTPTTYIDTQCQ